MFADNGFFIDCIKKDCVYNAGIKTFSAADAFIRRQSYAAAFAGSERTRYANRGARPFVTAGAADLTNKPAGNSAACADFDCAFKKRVALLMGCGANNHTAKTADAFVHV
jgi:hypothetical protein